MAVQKSSKRKPIQKITRIALLGAILYVSKVALDFLPNVELVSFLTILYTLVFGSETLLIILVFNMFQLIQWGFGVWWVSYLYTWPLLALLVLVIRKILVAAGGHQEEFVLWAVVSGCFGLAFGGLFALAYLPVDPGYALAYWISGLPWDVWHGTCNFMLMLCAGRPVYRGLKAIMEKTGNITKI